MIELELERRFLARYLPTDIADCPCKEVIDIYIPATAEHPILRLRKKGDRYEITKKQPVSRDDSSEQSEHTIPLSADEFAALSKTKGKKVRKIRYKYLKEAISAEIDVFQDGLSGLVLVDFEFKDVGRKEAFVPPDYCLADVTQENTFAGGMLCGKSYSDITERLEEVGYRRIRGPRV